MFLHGRPIGGVCLYNCNLVLLDSRFSYLFERLLNFSLKSGKVASSAWNRKKGPWKYVFSLWYFLLSFWFNVWNIIHSIIDTILMLSFNIFVDRLEVKHFVRNWKRDKSNFAFSESTFCNDWFLLFCLLFLLFLLYVFCFTFCCHVYQMIEINDKMNQLPDDCPLAWNLKLWK